MTIVVALDQRHLPADNFKGKIVFPSESKPSPHQLQHLCVVWYVLTDARLPGDRGDSKRGSAKLWGIMASA